MMRRAARTDDNQTAIVKALRKAGCQVFTELAKLGYGCPDLLVYRGRCNDLFLLEVKDGAKSKSRRKLTPLQVEFKQNWPVQVVTNEIEALRAVGL